MQFPLWVKFWQALSAYRHSTCNDNIDKVSITGAIDCWHYEVMMEDKKKRKILILLALLALLIGLLIPFTWRSYKAVKASLLQEGSLESLLTKTDPDTFSGNVMHGGWIPSSTPTNRPTATLTATIPPFPTSTSTNTATIPPSPTSTVTNTVTYPPKVTETIQATSTSTWEVTKTISPTLVTTTRTNVPLGGTETPEVTETGMPTSALTATLTFTPAQRATAPVPPTTTVVPNVSELPHTPPPSLPPTVGPGGNPTVYSTAGLVFGIIAVAALFLYFSGVIITRRNQN
jgi:hypothetical protein